MQSRVSEIILAFVQPWEVVSVGMLHLVMRYSTTTTVLVAVAVSSLLPTATVATHVQSVAVPPLLTLANDAVSVGFSSATGELASLINLVAAGGPDDYLVTPPAPPPSPPSPPPAPSCVGNDAGTAFYIKTGGDASVRPA